MVSPNFFASIMAGDFRTSPFCGGKCGVNFVHVVVAKTGVPFAGKACVAADARGGVQIGDVQDFYIVACACALGKGFR